MVSQAGAMALSGLLPAVHSFACFLTPRADEQIYNNATEGTKVIYAGSLAGIVPGGPGPLAPVGSRHRDHGRDPGMALIEPFCEPEAALALDWAVDEAAGPVYIRLVSVPWDLGFERAGARTSPPAAGRCCARAHDVVLVAHRPRARVAGLGGGGSAGRRGRRPRGVVALPWLRDIDGAWLADVAGDATVVTLDNHYLDGGQGSAVLAALDGAGVAVQRLGVDRVPACGRNDEVLRAHGLDADVASPRPSARGWGRGAR